MRRYLAEPDRAHESRTCSTGHKPRTFSTGKPHRRPISAETLRKRLHVGAGTARSLVAQLRGDIKATFDTSAPEPAADGAV